MQKIIRLLSIFTLTAIAAKTTLIALPSPYEQARMASATSNLQRFMQQPNIPQSIWVDCCCSGGGYRAMIATVGLIAGLQNIAIDKQTSLYDCIRNMACLSGSTWAIGNLMTRDIPLEQFVPVLKDRVLNQNFTAHLVPTLHHIAHHLEPQYEKLRKIQVVDLYGGLIADRLMGDLGARAHDVSFCDLGTLHNAPKYPYPLFTTIHPDTTTWLYGLIWHTCYDWFEINPDITRQTLAPLVGNSIPTGLLGVRITPTPIHGFDQVLFPLSTILGICGSAYACSIGDIMSFLTEGLISYFKTQKPKTSREREAVRIGIISALGEIATSLAQDGRLCPATIPNFTQLNGKELELVDAGIDCNLPLPPLLERHSPIIIVCDADSSTETYKGNFPELWKAAAYAKKNNLPFPSLKYPEKPQNSSVRVFKRNKKGVVDRQVPTILYFHNIVEKNTFDFTYTNEEFDAVFNEMFGAVVGSADIIRGEIGAKIVQLQS